MRIRWIGLVLILPVLALLVVPVSDTYRGYGDSLVQRLRAKLVRAELAAPGETVARNVREASERKVPNVLIVGRREAADASVTLRRFGLATQLTISAEAFETELSRAIQARCGPEESFRFDSALGP